MKYLKSMCIALLLATTIPSSNISALGWDETPSGEWGSTRKVGMTIYGILAVPWTLVCFLAMDEVINSNKSSWNRGRTVARLTRDLVSVLGGGYVIINDICTRIENGQMQKESEQQAWAKNHPWDPLESLKICVRSCRQDFLKSVKDRI